MRRALESRTVLALLLVLWVALVFGQVVSFDFLAFDDGPYVVDNPHVRAGLTLDGVAWALTATRAGLWHPLTWVSHMLDATLWGMAPGGHHLTSVVLHGGSAVLLFLSLDRLSGARGRSFMVAALFALHPLRADSVAWVAERKDALSAFFLLATLYAYAFYVERPSGSRYALVLLAFVFASASKPSAVPFPAALLLIDAWPARRLRRSSWHRCLLEKAPLLGVSLAASLVTLRAHARSVVAFPLPVRLENAVISCATQFLHLFCPTRLSIFHPHWFYGGARLPPHAFGWSLALLIALLAATVVCARDRPYVSFGLAWFGGLFLPVSGVVQVGMGATADRFGYLPSIGICIAVIWLAADLLQGAGPGVRASLASATIGIYAVLAFIEVGHYRDTRAAFSHALESSRGDNWMAEEQLGSLAFHAGDFDTAIARFQRSLARLPTNPGCLEGLGVAEQAVGRSHEAVSALRRAIALEPPNPNIQVELCRSLVGAKAHREAVGCYKTAVALAPKNPLVRNDLCVALLADARRAEAESCLRGVIEVAPRLSLPYENLAELLRSSGRGDEADATLQRAKALAIPSADAP